MDYHLMRAKYVFFIYFQVNRFHIHKPEECNMFIQHAVFRIPIANKPIGNANNVKHIPVAKKRLQHTRGQQYASGVFCGPSGDRYYAMRDTRGQQYRRRCIPHGPTQGYITYSFVTRDGFEYLHRSPESRRRRQKGKSRIWDSTILSRVPRNSDSKMIVLARASSNCKWQTHPLVRDMLYKDYDRTCSIEKKIWP
jgi:hypothetical protein